LFLTEKKADPLPYKQKARSIAKYRLGPSLHAIYITVGNSSRNRSCKSQIADHANNA
jgi:hypothetical protein